jgi:ComF family protein
MLAPLRILLDTVLPARCPACRVIVDGDDRFCAACWQQLAFITAPLCARCGAPFEHDMGPAAECAECLASPPRYDSARAALAYGGPARDVILGLKHGDRQHLARLMARAMARAAGPLLDPAARPLLVPVPLHWTRLWQRGANQAALVAGALHRQTGAELALLALTRARATPVSRGLGRAARAKNVRGVFRVTDRERVARRRILLIDDVLTTGATAEACARVLRRAGAAEVHVLTFARVVRQG